MKKITLNIGTRMIFDALADISVANGEDREKVVYALAKEAVLHSFTPSGEIGDNPSRKDKITISYAPNKEKLYNKERHKFAKDDDQNPLDFFVTWATVTFPDGELVVEKFVTPTKDGFHFMIDDGNANVAWGDSTVSVIKKWLKKFG